nr:hypothetical protein Itr_chr02CG01740 [Ipomoea trifida]
MSMLDLISYSENKSEHKHFFFLIWFSLIITHKMEHIQAIRRLHSTGYYHKTVIQQRSIIYGIKRNRYEAPHPQKSNSKNKNSKTGDKHTSKAMPINQKA